MISERNNNQENPSQYLERTDNYIKRFNYNTQFSVSPSLKDELKNDFKVTQLFNKLEKSTARNSHKVFKKKGLPKYGFITQTRPSTAV